MSILANNVCKNTRKKVVLLSIISTKSSNQTLERKLAHREQMMSSGTTWAKLSLIDRCHDHAVRQR